MNTLAPEILDRLYELLGERQNGTLTDAQLAELDTLLANPAAQQAEAEFEQTQAALLLAFVDHSPARMRPDALDRLEAVGVGMTGGVHTVVLDHMARVSGRGAIMGWIAAAIFGAVALVGWLRSPPAPMPVPVPPITKSSIVADKLASLLKEPGTATVTLAAQKDQSAQGASGVAVWNNDKQEGYLRLKGLARNDPSKEQYQLWIFDASRETYPIDAGVFDMSQAAVDPATGDTIIPMNAKLPVGKPAAIAITVEKPGGVVVTDKSRLAMLGAVQ